ncbi:thiamine phosphate synthase [Olivibacter sp. CPCC 100613]|uniref:thiamine phosphate synthase n=1 Tax=Olivibacter sp. CPCC 100613 TaxID=3079931 RepID=UPI002FF9C795
MSQFKKTIERLQYITQAVREKSILDQVKITTKEGIRWIQFRLKTIDDNTFKQQAIRCMEVSKQHQCTFLINDRVHIAKEIDADGVHIGKDDLSPSLAREILGPNKIIGCTANTIDDIIRLSKQPIDYIGLGPFRFTKTKEKLSPTLGLTGYREIIGKVKDRHIDIPIIAIGGIHFDDIDPLFQTGIHGIAVSGIISNSSQPQNDCQNLLKQIALQSCPIA